jgi:diadenosine tetraphosphate (Ap4A) HIT family hydrolase
MRKNPEGTVYVGPQGAVWYGKSMKLESPEDYYARLAACCGSDGRLPTAVEGALGWETYPYEPDSLRLKALMPLAEAEPARHGEEATECWCALPDEERPDWFDPIVWRNERWVLTVDLEQSLPVFLMLSPTAGHYDLATLPDDLAAEMGQLMVAVSAAVESLPSVGRCQLARWGDGGAHLHLAFLGRPARVLQFRGSGLLDWAINLPDVPRAVLIINALAVATSLQGVLGGEVGELAATEVERP